MYVSFAASNHAEGRILAQELEHALIARQVPPKLISMRQSSRENMDAGSWLGLLWDHADHLMLAGHMAIFAKSIFEVASKHRTPVVLVNEDGTTFRIPLSELSIADLKKAIEDSAADKTT